jgi:hypothetical protein
MEKLSNLSRELPPDCQLCIDTISDYLVSNPLALQYVSTSENQTVYVKRVKEILGQVISKAERSALDYDAPPNMNELALTFENCLNNEKCINLARGLLEPIKELNEARQTRSIEDYKNQSNTYLKSRPYEIRKLLLKNDTQDFAKTTLGNEIEKTIKSTEEYVNLKEIEPALADTMVTLEEKLLIAGNKNFQKEVLGGNYDEIADAKETLAEVIQEKLKFKNNLLAIKDRLPEDSPMVVPASSAAILGKRGRNQELEDERSTKKYRSSGSLPVPSSLMPRSSMSSTPFQPATTMSSTPFQPATTMETPVFEPTLEPAFVPNSAARDRAGSNSSTGFANFNLEDFLRTSNENLMRDTAEDDRKLAEAKREIERKAYNQIKAIRERGKKK